MGVIFIKIFEFKTEFGFLISIFLNQIFNENENKNIIKKL